MLFGESEVFSDIPIPTDMSCLDEFDISLAVTSADEEFHCFPTVIGTNENARLKPAEIPILKALPKKISHSPFLFRDIKSHDSPPTVPFLFNDELRFEKLCQ